MEISLDGKVAFITGGGSGIGRGIAELFASNGAAVVVADLDAESGGEAASGIAAAGGRALFVELDVTDEASVAGAFGRTISEFGTVDILVNSAGTDCMSLVDELIIEEWDMVIDTNLKGTFMCLREASRIMKPKGTGKIINVSSINDTCPVAGEIPYCASKGGVRMLTRSAALELAPYGIHVNAVAPGTIDTPLMSEMLQVPEIREGLLRQQPSGRLGRPEDVARAALYLASDLSDWVTGVVLNVDGGMHLVGEISHIWPVFRVMGEPVPEIPICQAPEAPEEE